MDERGGGEEAVECLLAGEPAEEGDAIGNAERAGQRRQACPLRPVPDDPVLGVREIRRRERAQPQVEALPVKQVADADETKAVGTAVGGASESGDLLPSEAHLREDADVPRADAFSLSAVSAVVASARRLRRAVRRTNGSSSPAEARHLSQALERRPSGPKSSQNAFGADSPPPTGSHTNGTGKRDTGLGAQYLTKVT